MRCLPDLRLRLSLSALLPVLAMVAVPLAIAQTPRFPQAAQPPDVGYIYPAGGQAGTTVEVVVGGQALKNAEGVHLSGGGVAATVGEFHRPLTQNEFNRLRNKLEEAKQKMLAAKKPSSGAGKFGFNASILKYAREAGVTPEDLKALEEYRKLRLDPKRQLNPQLADTVTVKLAIAPDAAPGPREFRLRTAAGLSNPLTFHVGSTPEQLEKEPNDHQSPPAEGGLKPPLVFNGQIMPGDVDRFSFLAKKGEKLTVATRARDLVPHLADAVPGWFQATLAVYDEKGTEVAFQDDYRFDPDPALLLEIPADGSYTVEIRDAIYRGREDFVYRISIGSLPFVTGIFPLGGYTGSPTAIEVKGWNLPIENAGIDTTKLARGTHLLKLFESPGQQQQNSVRFAVDDLPEYLDREPNDTLTSAQRLPLPVTVNGRIDRAGDWDTFEFNAEAGQSVTAEVFARRLNSPVDSVLKLLDANGQVIASNDDHEDRGEGLLTHHADSLLTHTLPARGAYRIQLGDAQNHGGPDYGYRLRISPPRPDFALRVFPSSINARAGAVVPVTVCALRKDGFQGDIRLKLVNPPAGFFLSGGWVPSGQDQVRLTLAMPQNELEEPAALQLEGVATIGGAEVTRRAAPAEDMMQAFIYHHLVPTRNWLACVSGQSYTRSPLKVQASQPIRLPAGGSASVKVISAMRLPADVLQLTLSDPPEGIALGQISSAIDGVTIELKADAGKVKPGLKGNLILNASVRRSSALKKAPTKFAPQNVPMATLPAIPFEIVEK